MRHQRTAAGGAPVILSMLLIVAVVSVSAGEAWRSVWVGPVTVREIRELEQLGFDLENVRDGRARFYVDAEEEALLRYLGYVPVPEVRMDPLVPYPTLDEIFSSIDSVVSAHPDICELVEIGTSVQGRPIRAVVVSDNVGTEEVEPELRIHGAIHGDEPASATTTLHYLKNLTDYYGTSSMCTYIVDTAESWIIPVLNPDGYYADQRYNANGVDLNRNLSYMWDGGGPYPFSEPETQALRDLTMQSWPDIENFVNPFVTGLSLHGGAACFNYVWNYSSDPVPDTLMIVEMANDYAALCTIPGFWITEGWAWYIIHGDVNDWSYGECGTVDHTIEVHEDKHVADWPWVSTAHYMAILDFFVQSTYGIYGTVETSSGDPLDALIGIGISDGLDSEPLRFCMTDVTLGDYHKSLLPGTYDVMATVEGFPSQTVTGVSVGQNERVEVNFVFGTGIGEEGEAPADPAPMLHARTNPFFVSCSLIYDTGGSPGRVRIYDVLGRLVLDSDVPAGSGQYVWSPGRSTADVPDGLYFASLEAGASRLTLPLVRLGN